MMHSNCMQYCTFEILKTRVRFLLPKLECWCTLKSYLWFCCLVVASAALREGVIIIIEANSLGGSYGAVSLSWCLTKATRNERISLKKTGVGYTWHIKPKTLKTIA